MTADGDDDRFEWEDERIARRIRETMPDESPIDLDEHTRRIAREVAAAQLRFVDVEVDDGR